MNRHDTWWQDATLATSQTEEGKKPWKAAFRASGAKAGKQPASLGFRCTHCIICQLYLSFQSRFTDTLPKNALKLTIFLWSGFAMMRMKTSGEKQMQWDAFDSTLVVPDFAALHCNESLPPIFNKFTQYIEPGAGDMYCRLSPAREASDQTTMKHMNKAYVEIRIMQIKTARQTIVDGASIVKWVKNDETKRQRQYCTKWFIMDTGKVIAGILNDIDIEVNSVTQQSDLAPDTHFDGAKWLRDNTMCFCQMRFGQNAAPWKISNKNPSDICASGMIYPLSFWVNRTVIKPFKEAALDALHAKRGA